MRYRGVRCNKEPRDHIRKAAGVAPRRVYWAFSQDIAEHVATRSLGITFGRRQVLHHVAFTGQLFPR